MPAVRALRPNIFVLVLVAGLALLLGIDRFVELTALRPVAITVYEWGVLLGAFALLLGVINVTWVHVRRIVAGDPGWLQSLLLIVAMVVVLATGLFSTAGVRSPLGRATFLTPSSPLVKQRSLRSWPFLWPPPPIAIFASVAQGGFGFWPGSCLFLPCRCRSPTPCCRPPSPIWSIGWLMFRLWRRCAVRSWAAPLPCSLLPSAIC